MSRRNLPRSFVGSLRPPASGAWRFIFSGCLKPPNKLQRDQLRSVDFHDGWNSRIKPQCCFHPNGVSSSETIPALQCAKATTCLLTSTRRSLALPC